MHAHLYLSIYLYKYIYIYIYIYIYSFSIAHHQLQRTQIQHKVPLVYGLPRVLLVRHHDCSIDWQRHEGYDVIWDRRHPWFRVDLRRSPPGGRPRCVSWFPKRGWKGPMTGKSSEHGHEWRGFLDISSRRCQRMSVDWFIGKKQRNPRVKP